MIKFVHFQWNLLFAISGSVTVRYFAKDKFGLKDRVMFDIPCKWGATVHCFIVTVHCCAPCDVTQCSLSHGISNILTLKIFQSVPILVKISILMFWPTRGCMMTLMQLISYPFRVQAKQRALVIVFVDVRDSLKCIVILRYSSQIWHRSFKSFQINHGLKYLSKKTCQAHVCYSLKKRSLSFSVVHVCTCSTLNGSIVSIYHIYNIT